MKKFMKLDVILTPRDFRCEHLRFDREGRPYCSSGMSDEIGDVTDEMKEFCNPPYLQLFCLNLKTHKGCSRFYEMDSVI